MRVRSLTEAAYLQLIRTSRRIVPATLWITGGSVLNVYTREWLKTNIVVAGERIAYVGDAEPLIDEQTEIIDASGYYLVPGYIEPHAHPFQWYNPTTLSNYALQTGTTTLVSDTLFMTNVLPLAEVEEILDQLKDHPVKQFFWARLDPQSQKTDTNPAFSKEGLARMLSHPLVVQGGELTSWGGFLAEDEDILFGMKHARDLGKRMEGHHPGASVHTLNTAAAAGVTACHESITAEEVLHRLRLGFYATLRHSSIRPDMPELVKGCQELGIPFGQRMMLTSDGSTPPMLQHGLTDYTIRVAIEAGVPPIDAYVMASLQPAAYYGLDAEIGGIAPGRIADILFLPDPADPTPAIVLANGKRWAEKGQLLDQPPAIAWREYGFPQIAQAAEKLGQLKGEWFTLRTTEETVPVIHMENAVITSLRQEQLPRGEYNEVLLDDHPGLAYLNLLDPGTQKVTQAIVSGFGCDIEGIASTYTVSAAWLAMGRDAAAMKQALQRVVALGGGLVVVERGEIVYEMPLPLAGKMTDVPMEEVIARGVAFDKLMRTKGHTHLDPIYSLLFFTATHLPYVRLTPQGIYDVKRGAIIQASTDLVSQN